MYVRIWAVINVTISLCNVIWGISEKLETVSLDFYLKKHFILLF